MIKKAILGLMLISSATALAQQPPRGHRSGAEADRAERRDRLMEREDELLALVKEHAPDRFDTLVGLKTTDPDAYFRTLRRIAKVYRETGGDEQAVGRKIEMHSLERDLHELARGFDALPAGEQKTRRKEMDTLGATLFGLRQDDRRANVARLEARLDELKTEIDDREKNQEEVIERFIDHLIEGKPRL